LALEGMDVDQAQRLAQQFSGHAQALAHITAGLGTLVAELSQHWRGSASAAFQQQWSAQYQGAISGAAHALGDMRTHLAANIQQQIQASGAGTGGYAPGSGLRSVISGATLAGLLGFAWKGYELTENVLGLSRNANVIGRYDKTWTQVLKLANGSTLLRYKKSPILQWLNKSKLHQADLLLEKLPAKDLLVKASGIYSLVEAGSHLGKAAADIAGHHYAAAGGEVVDATASGLQSSRNPLLYLTGVSISLIHADLEASHD
jgi:uncharacterized protein YukE